jgi:tetratricopeptide (TPR) repeat protein
MRPDTLLRHHPPPHSAQVLQALGFAIGLFACLIVNASTALAQKTEADVFVAQAILAYDDKRYEEALKLLREALAIDASSIEAFYYTGLVYNAQQKPVEAAQALEKAYVQNPTDPAIQYQLGITYFILQQYDKAEPLLTEVFKTQPQKDNLGYYLGFMRYRHKDYEGAIQAFTKGTATDPDIQQLVRFYSGLALAILGRPAQAASELEEASRIRTVSPLTGPADRLRDTYLAAQEKDRRFHTELRVGAYFDTNVAINPLSSSDPLVLALRSRRTNTPGQLYAGRAEYAWFRSGPWEGTMSGSIFKTSNNEIPFFNIGNYLGGTGVNYRGVVGALPYQISALYNFDYTTLSGSRFLNRHSAVLQGVLVENAGNLTTLQFRLQNKDFSDIFLIGGGSRPEEDRSANNWMAGLTHVFRFAGDKHLIRIGYQYDLEDAKGVDWFYRGHRGLVGFQYTLPWGATRLKYDFDLHYRMYPHPNAVFPTTSPGTVKQEVFEQNHIFRIEKPLPYNFTLAADFQATISRANLPFIFNYNRTVSTLSLAWGF